MLLTLVFVMLAEVLIFVPSMANFRNNWLRDRLAAARTAAFVLDVAPSEAIPESLVVMLLDNVGAKTIAMKIEGTRRLLAVSDMPVEVERQYDLRDGPNWSSVMESFDTLAHVEDRLVRVMGPAPMGGEFIEVVLNERPLRDAMLKFAINILLLSLLVSSVTGVLVYASLQWLIVRPVKRLAMSIAGFSQDAEDTTRIIKPSNRRDELGEAERELAKMQRALGQQLKEKEHLAALGLAVAKINHDLRNMLASAHLLSDRLGSVPDPTVQRIAPKLISALDRAVRFCQATLTFGRAQEQPPVPRVFSLDDTITELRDLLGLGDDDRITFIADIPVSMRLRADPEHLLRVLINLCRNALEAMRLGAAADAHAGTLTITARRLADTVEIDVADTGPGVPAQARAKLFKAFSTEARSGGTGLGLAIAADLMRAQGGRIVLIDTLKGAAFRVILPA